MDRKSNQELCDEIEALVEHSAPVEKYSALYELAARAEAAERAVQREPLVEWTIEPPTEPGWYWVKRPWWTTQGERREGVMVVELRIDGEVESLGTDGSVPASDCDFLAWSGPLKPPE